MLLKTVYSVKDANEQRQAVWDKLAESHSDLATMFDVKWYHEHFGLRIQRTFDLGDPFPTVHWRMTLGVIVVEPDGVNTDGDEETVLVGGATPVAQGESVDQVTVSNYKPLQLKDAYIDVPLQIEYTITIHRDRILPPRRDQNPVLSMMTSGTALCLKDNSPAECIQYWSNPGPHWGTIIDLNDGRDPKPPRKPKEKPTPTLIIP